MIEFSPLQRTAGLRPAQKRRGKEEFSSQVVKHPIRSNQARKRSLATNRVGVKEILPLPKLSIRPSSPDSRLNVCLRPGDADHRTPSSRIQVVAAAHICVYGLRASVMTGVS